MAEMLSYEDFRAGFVTVEVIQATCQTCRFPLEWKRFADGTLIREPHYYCDKPSVKLAGHEPVFLDGEL